MSYRELSKSEIKALENNGCISTDWKKVKVKDSFTTDNIKNSTFDGDVELGVFEDFVTLSGNVKKRSGIYNSYISNCIVGDNSLIENINGYLSNCIIGSCCYIGFSGPVYCEETSYFGHDVKANVMIETGGREVPLCTKLTSQSAYLLTMYRHDNALTERLKSFFTDCSIAQSSEKMNIGNNVVIVNSKEIKNVNIGDFTRIAGAEILDNGTIESNEVSPVIVGSGVIAKGFIMLPGSEVSDSSQIFNTFVGESVRISKGFTSHDSLFFANSIMENGEACSIFAAPFSVSMHKSTLLIGGFFSFMNAGSGSNQSNHLYKLGPIHQGVLERGVALSSDSYLMWPAHIGAFTMVMGRHYTHPDIENMPFSTLIQQGDKSILTPGVNFNKIGVLRDSQKWPNRDKRKGDKRDIITHGLLNPYTISRVVKGYNFLYNKSTKLKPRQDYVNYNGTIIKASKLEMSLDCYYNAITMYISEKIIEKINEYGDPSQFAEALKVPNIGDIDWKDLAGMITPKEGVEQIISHIKDGVVNSVDELESEFKELNSGYSHYEWIWCARLISQWYGIDINNITKSEFKKMLELGYNAIIMNGEFVLEDAMKEYDDKLKVSFGLHENLEETGNEFKNIRGDFDSQPVVAQLRKFFKDKASEYHKLSII